jgi:hypothetical protein
MKANQLATLVLRLLGVYCLLEFVASFVMTSPALPVIFQLASLNRSESVMAITVVVFLALQLAVGVMLIVKSTSWGEKLTPQNMNGANITQISFEQIQVLAFAVAGTLIFSNALPQLLNSLASLFAAISQAGQITGRYSYEGNAQYNIWRMSFSAFGTILKAALGLWMFFGAHGFAHYWRSLKNFGTPKPPEN